MSDKKQIEISLYGLRLAADGEGTTPLQGDDDNECIGFCVCAIERLPDGDLDETCREFYDNDFDCYETASLVASALVHVLCPDGEINEYSLPADKNIHIFKLQTPTPDDNWVENKFHFGSDKEARAFWKGAEQGAALAPRKNIPDGYKQYTVTMKFYHHDETVQSFNGQFIATNEEHARQQCQDGFLKINSNSRGRFGDFEIKKL